MVYFYITATLDQPTIIHLGWWGVALILSSLRLLALGIYHTCPMTLEAGNN